MSRLRPLDTAALDARQRAVHDAIAAGPRGGVRGPLAVWLRAPDFADVAQKLGEHCRYRTALDPRLSELAILVTARHWQAGYEWHAHVPHALKAGLAQEIVTAIEQRISPVFARGDERIVYDFAVAVHESGRVPDTLYAEAVAAFGEAAVVELVGVLGYYTLVAMTLNVFEIPSSGA